MTTVEERVSSNPFPGLRPFAADETDRFFGRRQHIEELADRLGEVSFVAVAGSSGCGKSSLVLAGLLGELGSRRNGEDETEWRFVVMRPGNQPIANLAEQLSPLLRRGSGRSSEESHARTLYGRLRLGGLGLVEAVGAARLDPHIRVLVVVDQFEEIFRFKRMTDPDEASAFIKLLLNAGRDPQSPVSVVITLRSDTLGYCADFRDLPETINRGQYLVPKLTREQRKDTIVRPVELRGFKVAPRLVQRLLNDVSDDFDDLPVMQHALTRTWARWAEASQGLRPIDLEDYEAVGTAKHALSNHADEAFGSLPGLEPVVERVFRALTERVAEGTELRRPLELNRLCQVVGGVRRQVEEVVERFRRPDTAFLVPPGKVPLADNAVIDISHESLIRQWHRLRQWAQVESESRAVLLRLVDAARRHESNKGSLWRGPDLARALEWQQATKPTPAWVALYAGGDGASTAAWESAKTFLVRSAKDAGRQRRRHRSLVISLCGLAVATVVVSVFAAVLGFRLLKQGMSRALMNKALLEIDQDPARSARLALAAMDRDPANLGVELALRTSLAVLEVAHTVRILPHDEAVLDARFSDDASRLVTASGKTVTIFDGRTFEKIGAPITREAGVQKAWLIANSTILVTHTYDGEGHGDAQVQRLSDSRTVRLSCEGDGDSVYKVAVSTDGRYVATGCLNGRVLVWEATTLQTRPKQAFRHRAKRAVTITALAFSGDGTYLASGDADGTVNLWSLGQGQAWIGQGVSGVRASPIKHDKAIRDVGFHPDDPSLLVTAGDDEQAVVWRLDLKGRRLGPATKDTRQRWPLKHERPVVAAQFAVRAADAAHLVVTVSDKTARLWTNAEEQQVRGHDDWVNEANASGDGELLFTASSDGTARLWSTRSGSPLAVLRGHRDDVTRAVISPDGRQMVTASADHTVRIWHVRAPRLLARSDHWALSAAFAPDGLRVAVGEEAELGRASVLELKEGGEGVAARQALPAVSLNAVGYVSWSRDGKFLAAVNAGHGVDSTPQPVLWDVQRKRDISPEWLANYFTATFSPGTDELLTVARDGQVDVWDVATLANAEPRPKLSFGKHPGSWIAAMSPDGRWVAALKDHAVLLWRREEFGAAPRVLTGHQGQIKWLEFSRDSKRLLTASSDRTARVWPVDRPALPIVLRGGHTAALSSAAFDPRGMSVVTGSADSTIRVWDAETGNQRAVLRWHAEGVNQVQFSPDGKWILSASDDGTVKLAQCEVCNVPVKELRERVSELAQLPADELKEIEQETGAVMPYFKLPALFSRDR